jgi:hypothetical protein
MVYIIVVNAHAVYKAYGNDDTYDGGYVSYRGYDDVDVDMDPHTHNTRVCVN